MPCEYSDNCIFYRTYRYKSDSKKVSMLAESYCEGNLQAMCRRKAYQKEFGKEPPPGLAPNGYLIGTHQKLRMENTRKFKRHKIQNGACMLQVLGTQKAFSAWIVDISEGGVRLDLSISPEELDISPGGSLLRILGYSVASIPFAITKEVVKPVWQSHRVMGCSFV